MVERMQSGEFRGGFGANRGELSEDAMPPSMEGAEGEGWAMPEGRFTPRAAMFGGNATGSSFQVLSESGEIQLREGLTVTVSIITETRNDVVLVPSAAISNQGGQQVVTVVLSDETEEVRVIETGLSDWQNTEVLSGLTEGEQVVVPLGTSSTSSFEQQGGMFMPRIVGGGGR